MINHARMILALMAVPVMAQVDLSGSWAPRNYGDALSNRPGPGPSPVDYLGLPFNEAARERALIYSPSQISMPDRICSLYTPVYVMLGPFGLKIWNETEARNGTTIAWKIGAWEDRAVNTIWMDGRPHPSKYAPHEVSGFTTGVWEDDVLTTYTTHMKAGVIRRNGAPSSDQASATMRFFRHGDILTVTARVEDPIYLEDPLYLTRTFQWSGAPPIASVGVPCVPGNEGVPEGAVPHFLRDSNPFVDELTRNYNIPRDAVLGGPETMYPEYRKKIKDKYVIPEKCTQYCGGPGQYPLRTN